MSNLFSVDFENNKLYDPGAKGFDVIFASGGTLEVTTGSKYAGSYGLAVSPLVNYKLAGMKRVNHLTRFRQAFYLHPNAISIPTTRGVPFARNYHNDATDHIYSMTLGYTTGTGYWIECSLDVNSEGYYWSSSQFVLDNQTDWNLIETDWYANNSSGFFQIWINGTSKWTRSLVNGNLHINYPCIGAIIPTYTISGSFFIDNWRANDDGSEIGA